MKYLIVNNYIYLANLLLFSSYITLTLNFSSRNLQFLDPNCNTFQSSGFCQKCSQRFYMNMNNKLCTKVSDSCATWNINNGNCVSCYLGYTLQKNGECIRGTNLIQNINCIQYKQDLNNQQINKICLKCGNGFYLDANNICQLLPNNCINSNQNGYCIQCINNYKVSNGVCVIKPIDYCLKYTIIYSSLLNWLFNRGGKRVCQNCINGFYLDSNYICQPLPKYCISAKAGGTCTQCIKNYKIVNGLCLLDECAQYLQVYDSIINLLLRRSRKVCKSCRSGFYLDSNNNCIVLPKNCVLGNQDGICTQCEKSFNLQKGLCSPQVCPQYQYLTSANNFCYRCKNSLQINFLCIRLPLNCASLKIPQLSCNRCIDYFILKDGVCISIINNQKKIIL